MNAAVVPFRLLIINDSQDEAQRLTSMFQNAGRPCRAQHISHEEAFVKIIEEQGWDLVIAHSDATSLTPAVAIRTIRQYNHDLPVILLIDDDSQRTVIDGMKLGACDVIKLDDDQHLLLVVNRELENRQQRKNTRLAERKVREMEQRNHQLLDSSKNGIALIQDGMYNYTNDSFAQMCGYSNGDEINYLPVMDMIHDEDKDKLKSTLKNFLLQNDAEKNNHVSFKVRTAEGGYKNIEGELSLGNFEEEPCIELILKASLSNNETLAAEIESLKFIDDVTGLSNRARFTKQLDHVIQQASSDESSHGLLYIDIDQFESAVTASVGIDGGDEVLCTIADFLRDHSQTDDFLARTGDHAFAMITHESNIEKLLNTANVLCDQIREHFFEIKNKTVRLTISIGITSINETTIDNRDALNQVNKAIKVLRAQKNGIVGDGSNMYQAKNSEETVLGSVLQKALSDNRFKLLFQPVVSLRGDEVERYEVLLRMVSESGEDVSPTHFLQTAESMKVNTKIDRWVLLEAIKHLGNHNKKAGHAQLQVNISHYTLCDASVLPWLKVAFSAAKVDPSCIILQAPETEVSQHLTAAKSFIEEANSMGIEFCITHFGCALEPLSLIEHIDAKHIKVDNSFSVEIQENPNNTEGFEQLVSALSSRDKTIIVPMVENASILSTLWKLGVHCIQGNYLQPPGVNMDYEFGVENAG
ncbi:MAG: EAL domain-containing protein [Pseudomonadota bacterium]